jgi:transposase InsO family protein
MHNKKIVNGLNVDTTSPKNDCVACIQAKQSEKPFSIVDRCETQQGELTHMDLWGKYDVASINGSHYFLLIIDDASRYIIVKFLKTKDQTGNFVREHLTYLSVQGKKPLTIRMDRGREFINKELISWCQERGIETQQTAPYSPSQNGVAERVNHTLVELARTMLASTKLPEFLWEPVIQHAAYV